MNPDDIMYSVMSMLAVDGSISKQEQEFLKKLCQRLGLSQDVLQTMFENVKQGKGSIRFSENAAENKQLFHLFVQAALVDGIIAPQERAILEAAAAQMGISTTDLEQALAPSAHAPYTSSKTTVQPDSPKYHVVFSGEIAEGGNLEEVKRRLASLFKMDNASVEKIFSGKRIVIKQNVDQQTAIKFQKAFEQAGAISTLEPLGAPSSSKPSHAQKKAAPPRPKASKKQPRQKQPAAAPATKPSKKDQTSQTTISPPLEEKPATKKVDGYVIEKMIEKKKISGQWTLNQLYSIFTELTNYDVQIEEKLARIKKITCIAFFMPLVSGILGIFLGSTYPKFLPLGIPLVVIAAVGGIIGWFSIRKYKNMDLSNDFREYIKPVLDELQDDIKEGSEVSIDLHLSPVEHKEFGIGRGAQYEARGYTCQEYLFERILATLKIRLSDGNRAIWTIHELLTKTEKTRWKRSRSGKRKRKSKTKRQKRITCDLRVVASSDKFDCKQIPQGREQKLYAKQSNGNLVLGLKYTEKLKEQDHLIPDPLLTIKGLVTLYTFLQPKTQGTM